MSLHKFDLARSTSEVRKLVFAVRQGSLHEVEILTKTHGLKGVDSYELLLLAIELNYVDIAKILIANNCELNIDDTKENSPLHNCASKGMVQLVKDLLAKGAKVNAPNKSNRTPLYYATKNGHDQIMTMLIEAGANLNRKEDFLHIAISRNHVKCAQILLSKHVSVNSVMRKRAVTALYVAAEKKNFQACKLLLSFGADTEICCTVDGKTALHIAVEKGDVEIVRLLLDNGADVFKSLKKKDPPHNLNIALKARKIPVPGTHGGPACRPLNAAVIAGNLEMIKLLMSYEVNQSVSRKERLDYYPYLFLAMLHCDVPVVHHILQHIPASRSVENFSAIIIASALSVSRGKKYTDFVRLLLGYGFPGSPEALRFAAATCYMEVLELLLKWGTRLRWEDDERMFSEEAWREEMTTTTTILVGDRYIDLHGNESTALDGAIAKKSLEMVKLIIKYNGRDFEQCDILNAVIAAYLVNSGDIIQYLLDSGTNLRIPGSYYLEYKAAAFSFGFGCDAYDKLIKYHVIKLRTARILPGKVDKKLLSDRGDPEFHERCKNEVSKLILDKVGDSNISFYEILLSSPTRLESYLENECVQDLLKKEAWKKKYPLYQGMLLSRLSSANEFKSLTIESKPYIHLFFRKFFPEFFSLPSLAQEKIMNSFTLESMRRTIAIYQSDTEVIRVL